MDCISPTAAATHGSTELIPSLIKFISSNELDGFDSIDEVVSSTEEPQTRVSLLRNQSFVSTYKESSVLLDRIDTDSECCESTNAPLFLLHVSWVSCL